MPLGGAGSGEERERRWDPSLYAGSAGYYTLGRVPYPTAVAETLVAGLGLDGSDRVLDVGCGPGR
jgi:trans-aconitate methyltransferase